MIKTLLILIILTAAITCSFGQEGLWIHAYSYKESDQTKYLIGDNRLFFKINKDSVLMFDAGKEKWEGKLVNGFKYIKKGNGFAASDDRLKSDIYFELNGKEQIKLQSGETHIILKKLSSSEILLRNDEVRDFVFNGFFTANLRKAKIDTISFFDSNHEKQYHFVNIGAELFIIDNIMFIHASDEGERIYPIIKLSKESLILGSYSTEQRNITFKRIELLNIEEQHTESLVIQRDPKDELFFSVEDALADKENVSKLTLSGQGINELPTSIKELINLKQLDLNNNHLTKLPDWIVDLKKLIWIRLSRNNFGKNEKDRILKLLPNCSIDFGDN